MVKALRVIMIVFGAIGILAGLSYMIIPDQAVKLYGFGEMVDYSRWFMGLGGASFVAAGVWVIVAARDPVRHINWVKFVITKSWLFVAVTVYAIIQGNVGFNRVGGMLILFAIFAILFLVFYPWRVKQSST